MIILVHLVSNSIKLTNKGGQTLDWYYFKTQPFQLDKNIRNLETDVSSLSAAKKEVEDKQAVEKKKIGKYRGSPI